MIVHFQLSGDDLGEPDQWSLVFEAERSIGAAVATAGVGEVDGNAFGGGEVVLFTYDGPDAEALCRVMEPGLRILPFRPAHARTHHAPDGETFAAHAPCECFSATWPALETTANGYVIRAVPSSNYSVMTNPVIGTFVARCTGCHARYPDPWVLDVDEPMPYAWREIRRADSSSAPGFLTSAADRTSAHPADRR